MTSRIFTLAYRGYDEAHVRKYFLSEPWTLWGYTYIVGGPWFGLVLIALFGAVFQLGYQVIRWVAGPFSVYLETAYLSAGTLSGLISFFGLDHLLTVGTHFGMGMVVACVSMVGFDWLFRLGHFSRRATRKV
jgi:hypothetical protein